MASKAAGDVVKATTSTQLRLIALPLCKKPDLVYYYAHKRQIKGKGPELPEEGRVSEIEPVNVPSKGRIAELLSKATNKATEQWEKLGNAPSGNWKHKIYMTGERMMDRIEYEEWLLKALDASTAPTLPKRRRKEGSPPLDEDSSVVPLYFPPSQVNAQDLQTNLRTMLDHREPHHEKLMKRSFWLMPVTLPIGLLPIVPNLPFFYVCWRAWSHWRAMKSSQYLKGIMDKDLLHPESSKILDELYKRREAEAQSQLTEGVATTGPKILLTREMVEEVVSKFELGEQAGVDLRRAIQQTEAKLKGEAS